MTGGETILVTGAGGFIGGRVIEILLDTGIATARAGVRRWASASRIGRFPVDIVLCDLMSPDQIRSALAGVDRIVHCAVGDRSATVDGTRNLLQSALEAGIRKIVHLSTVDVYGNATGKIGEESQLRSDGKVYGELKIEAEEICREYVSKGLDIVILRPTIVYGPFSDLWVVEFAERFQSGPWLLPEGRCEGTCNLVYVDDLVSAILAGLQDSRGTGEAFNINGPERPTWNEYFRALNTAMGLPPLSYVQPSASIAAASLMMPVRKLAKWSLQHFSDPIMALYKRNAAIRAMMKKAEHIIRQTPTTTEFDLYSKVLDFPTDKAQRMLGYRPACTMEKGVSLSAAWLRHHGMIRSVPLNT